MVVVVVVAVSPFSVFFVFFVFFGVFGVVVVVVVVVAAASSGLTSGDTLLLREDIRLACMLLPSSPLLLRESLSLSLLLLARLRRVRACSVPCAACRAFLSFAGPSPGLVGAGVPSDDIVPQAYNRSSRSFNRSRETGERKMTNHEKKQES